MTDSHSPKFVVIPYGRNPLAADGQSQILPVLQFEKLLAKLGVDSGLSYCMYVG